MAFTYHHRDYFTSLFSLDFACNCMEGRTSRTSIEDKDLEGWIVVGTRLEVQTLNERHLIKIVIYHRVSL